MSRLGDRERNALARCRRQRPLIQRAAKRAYIRHHKRRRECGGRGPDAYTRLKKDGDRWCRRTPPVALRARLGTEAGCQSVTGGGQVPPSSGRAENIFPRHILKREGSLDAARGSVAAVSSMIELIAMAVGAASAFIFLTHAIDAYRA